MIANHIHDALGQVRRLQALILEKRKFTGYSGTARMLGGSVALFGCVLMGLYVEGYGMHLLGWGFILSVGLAVNYGALVLWFVQLPDRERTLRTISPALDAIPPLAVGALFTAALLLKGHPDLLFGSWMCLYGLAHTTCRTALPKENGWLGFYYLACGAFFLLWPGTSFMNPWPAGVVFLVGEWIGGLVFHRHKTEAMEEYTDD
ncbi:hypothetical protein PDESU_05658 [Pontiella desulfatans]|uniref:Uncharacterized protein n=1 Tax=Pontiella desulfatans TaxID=2750659 RepID=A0A6C2UCG9_PONDE|nr:hypothetical protein [Pontiella desulfatans]VGO17064.1 hypothetical protein PDESU_05658 [Pontiella desulfatans]